MFLYKKKVVTQASAEGDTTNHEANAQSAPVSPTSNNSVSKTVGIVNKIIGDDPVQVAQGEDVTFTEAEERLMATPDSQLTPEQRAFKQNLFERKLNSTTFRSPTANAGLQSSANGGIIQQGDDVNGSTDTKLLAERGVSTAGRSGNSIREQGTNSAKLAGYLGNMGTPQERNTPKYRAGENGRILQKDNSQSGEARPKESVLRTISRIELSGKDIIGRKLSDEIIEKFKKTVFKDENGNLLSLYHWTKEVFDKIKKPDNC